MPVTSIVRCLQRHYARLIARGATILCTALATGLLMVAWQEVAAQKAGAVLTGSVLVDSLRVPIEGAEVSLPQLTKRTRTTSAGRFRFDSIPPGTQEVVVRHVGFSPATLRVAFAGTDSVEQTIVLRAAMELKPVTVEAAAVIPSFEEHRALGMGTFITRAELEQKEGQRLSEVVSQVRGARVQNGAGGRAFLYSGRRSVTSINPEGTKGDRDRFGKENAGTGASWGFCYVQVYLDDRIVYRGEEGEPVFDVNSVTPSQVEAIEYYAGPASTPMRYSRHNSNCGVLVIHTRRTLGSPKR